MNYIIKKNDSEGFRGYVQHATDTHNNSKAPGLYLTKNVYNAFLFASKAEAKRYMGVLWGNRDEIVTAESEGYVELPAEVWAEEYTEKIKSKYY